MRTTAAAAGLAADSRSGDARQAAPVTARPIGDRGRPAIAVRELTRRFGERTAFEELTFEVGRGEVFGFLGPNGAGKTTTVRVLSGLLPPTSGGGMVAGVELGSGDERELRARISVMSEGAGLYLRLTVRDNLEYFAGLQRRLVNA